MKKIPMYVIYDKSQCTLVYTGRLGKRQKSIPKLRKKGYRSSAPGVLLLQIAPFFPKGCFFSLKIMFVRKKHPYALGYYFAKQPKGVLFCKKRFEMTLFFKKRVLFWHP